MTAPTSGATPTAPRRRRERHEREQHGRRRRGSRWVALATGLVLLLGVASAAPLGLRFLRDAQGQPAVIGATDIAVTDSWFEPPVSEVSVGTTVTFTWAGDIAHDVVFSDGVGSPVQDDGTFTRRFDTPGSHHYRCTLHPFMEGRIEVVDQPAPGR